MNELQRDGERQDFQNFVLESFGEVTQTEIKHVC